jgi:hypothetical protein
VSTPVETPPDDASDEPRSRASGEAGPWRVYLGARVGMGGGIKFEDADVAWLTRVTPGFAVGGDYVLHRYFAVGAETRFDFASIEPAKFMYWSLMAKPRARHQLKQLPLEVYAALPVGLSISNAKDEDRTGKASAMLGIAAGASYFFNAHWAVNAELGWTWHWLRFEQPGTMPGEPTTVLYTARYGQMALALNLLYAF